MCPRIKLLLPMLITATVASSGVTPNASVLHQYLTSIAEWVMTTDVGSNNLTCSPSCGPPTHIFVNGNLARILLAAHKISPNKRYLAEGLRWCDSFVDLQIPITTSTGERAVVWDTGYNEVCEQWSSRPLHIQKYMYAYRLKPTAGYIFK